MTINFERNEIIKFDKTIAYSSMDNGSSKLRFGTLLLRISMIDAAL